MGWASHAKEQIGVMQFKLTNDVIGRRRFQTLHRGFTTWSRVKDNQDKRRKTMRPDEIAILEQLESVSVPVGLMGEDGIDVRPRQLKPGGGTLELDYSQLEMLIDRVDDSPLMLVEEAPAIEDAVQWLRTAKNADKKPENVREMGGKKREKVSA